MKTKSLSNNRVTRSHFARPSETAAASNRVSSETTSVQVCNSSVSNRDIGAISRQTREIQDTWTQAERDQRAQLGAQRRAELCALLFGAN